MSKKIELDHEHQKLIDRAQAKTRLQNEAHQHEAVRLRLARRRAGEVVLLRALRWKHESSAFERKLNRGLIVAWALTLGWSVYARLTTGWINFVFIANTLGINYRPFLLWSLACALGTLFSVRLKLQALFADFHQGMMLAQSDLHDSKKIEKRISVLRGLNELNSAVACAVFVAFAFSWVGWEVLLTTLSGGKNTLFFFLIMGGVVWFASRTLFALKDE